MLQSDDLFIILFIRIWKKKKNENRFLNSLDSTTRKNVEKSKPLNFQVIEEPDEMETQSEESIVKETSSNNSSFV